MSFSGMVKKELSKQLSNSNHCQRAELAGIFCSCGHIVREKDNLYIRIFTENEYVLRKCFTLLEKTFNIEGAVRVREGNSKTRGRSYTLDFGDPALVLQVLESLKLSVCVDGKTVQLSNRILIQKMCCKRAFIRGFFLASGSMSDPAKSYHLEIVCTDEEKALHVKELMCSFQIEAKIVVRKKSYVVYVKEGAQIVDVLAVMGANVSLMDLENIRIVKEVRNTVNRRVNCETANINKTVNAAVKQMEDIRLVEEWIGFHNLSEGLAQIAELRLQFPDASLKELGTMLSPQIGKSGVNHRLRKLSEMAEELRKNKEGYYD
ncbi:MAG: DNA-binding protein WhiA [Blautia sp.]|nr:DNA-binding protein WhiA [Blautia sp.]